MPDVNALKKDLEHLEELYRSCQKNRHQLMKEVVPDHVHLQQVTKELAELKEKITVLKRMIFPDIIA